ncbi:(deoxy)nucleoside triphosphate pyrophosphohydrolase [Membranihabitans marinus]|uniref:(deoxy)nucleoside triphosphate pyrophosphohydrolase n=1 Tax=Membranihabitans marinus TaxID=1227546 RepID=UPI001F184E9B|nr:(deoxy)nucleoside triphosphate pyrophosphohydrolase [Membranihabitans marinus]
MQSTETQKKDYKKKKVEVVAGIIYCGQDILCVQRDKNKLPYISEKYEFPGGKLEAGESRTQALQRELMEELNIQVEIQDFYLTVCHEYPDFELTMHSFRCRIPRKIDVILREHIDLKWLKNNQLNNLDWAAADIPIVDKIMADEG